MKLIPPSIHDTKVNRGVAVSGSTQLGNEKQTVRATRLRPIDHAASGDQGGTKLRTKHGQPEIFRKLESPEAAVCKASVR